MGCALRTVGDMRRVVLLGRAPDQAGLMDWETLLQGATATGAFGAMGLAAATWFRTRPAMVKAEADRDTSMLDRALMRIDQLEARDAVKEARISGLEQQILDERAIRMSERDKCEADLRILRHELANEIQAADAFLMLTERDPAKLQQNIAQIKEYREKKRAEIALEKGAMLGSRSSP